MAVDLSAFGFGVNNPYNSMANSVSNTQPSNIFNNPLASSDLARNNSTSSIFNNSLELQYGATSKVSDEDAAKKIFKEEKNVIKAEIEANKNYKDGLKALAELKTRYPKYIREISEIENSTFNKLIQSIETTKTDGEKTPNFAENLKTLQELKTEYPNNRDWIHAIDKKIIENVKGYLQYQSSDECKLKKVAINNDDGEKSIGFADGAFKANLEIICEADEDLSNDILGLLKDKEIIKGVEEGKKKANESKTTNSKAAANIVKNMYHAMKGIGTKNTVLDKNLNSINKDNVIEVFEAWHSSKLDEIGANGRRDKHGLVETILDDSNKRKDKQNRINHIVTALKDRHPDNPELQDLANQVDIALNVKHGIFNIGGLDDDIIAELVNRMICKVSELENRDPDKLGSRVTGDYAVGNATTATATATAPQTTDEQETAA